MVESDDEVVGKVTMLEGGKTPDEIREDGYVDVVIPAGYVGMFLDTIHFLIFEGERLDVARVETRNKDGTTVARCYVA